MEAAKHYRTCNLCEAMCGLEIEHRDGEILAIRGDRDDPLSRGHICPKAVALQDLHNDPDRLRHPVRRTADGWEEISWEEALDETARRLGGIRDEHGRDAVGIYVGNPTVHNHGALLMLLPLLKALRTRNRYSATSLDQLPHMLACKEMFGHQALFPVPDLERTRYFLVVGANPMASNGSVMTSPDIRNRLKEIRRRGGKVVVIDPRRTETAREADAHHFIRPGTDAYLLLAMLHVLYRDGRVDAGALAPLVDGVEQLEEQVREWTPERVAAVTGMEPEVIEELAREFADADGAAGYCRVGTSTSAFSGISTWLMYALNVVTGNLDRPGGLMFPQPAFDLVALAGLSGETGSFDRYRSRVRGLPEFGGEFPAVTLADEMLEPGEGQIRAMVTHAGNPVLSCPDGGRLDRAFSQLDFMVSFDIYINETTRHADIILPATSALEHGHFNPALHGLAVRNTVKFSPPLFEPPEGALQDWQAILELITRLNSRDRLSTLRARTVRGIVNRLGDRGLVDLGLRLGPYGSTTGALRRLDRLAAAVPLAGRAWKSLRERLAGQRGMPWKPREPHGDDPVPVGGLTLKKVEANPHGIDLGPLRPALPERLFTADRRVHLCPSLYLQDLPRMREALAEPVSQWLMIGRRHVRSNNSWMHNSRRLVKGRTRCDVMIHPDDADRLGVRHGEPVRVRGEAGTIDLPARVSEDIMPGVISVPHGWGHDREGIRLSVAGAHAGASINDVIGGERHEELTGMAILNGVPVSVERPA